MAAFNSERITHVHHWNDTLFSFKSTRDPGLRFKNGQFVMIGLQVNDKPLMRAYSIASANYEHEMEFFSIKVQNELLMSKKPTGTLVLDDLLPGKNLYMLSTGTGLAPFLGVIRDPETYERFEKVILIHGVRHVNELAYTDLIENILPNDEFFGELVKDKLIYYPTVTREPFRNQGRITTLIENGKLFDDIGLPRFNRETDRVMMCGSPTMLKDLSNLLDQHGLIVSPRMGDPGDYVIERAFVEK
jgi:ferredoxin--NADP+ reductase